MASTENILNVDFQHYPDHATVWDDHGLVPPKQFHIEDCGDWKELCRRTWAYAYEWKDKLNIARIEGIA